MRFRNKISAYQRRGGEKGCLVSLAARLRRKSVSQGELKGALWRGSARAPLSFGLLVLALVWRAGWLITAAGAGVAGEGPGVLTTACDSAPAAAVYAPVPAAGEDQSSVTRIIYRGAAGGAVRLLFPVGETVYLDVTPAAFPPETAVLSFTVTPVTSGTTGVSFAVYLDAGGAALPAPVDLGLPAGEDEVFLCQGERGWYPVAAVREGEHLFAPVGSAGTYGVAAAAYLPALPAGTFTGATLHLESAVGGEVWYTTDGSDPRESATVTRYTGPVQVGADGALTVRAAAYREGFWSEAVDFMKPGGGSSGVAKGTRAAAVPTPAKEGRTDRLPPPGPMSCSAPPRKLTRRQEANWNSPAWRGFTSRLGRCRPRVRF